MDDSQLSEFLTRVTGNYITREVSIGATQRVTKLGRDSLPSGSSLIDRPVVSLKTLYTDFEVRELPAFYGNGAPLCLDLKEDNNAATSGSSEPVGTKRPRDEALCATSADPPGQPVIAPDSSVVADTMRLLISAEDLSALLTGLAEEAKSISLPSVVEKEKRTELHQAIKACLGNTHVSTTVSGVVCVVRANAGDRREERRRSRASRPPPTYHHFTLYKENTDGNQALRMLAHHLKLASRQLQFCGTKDKRAVTLQRVAVRETTVERLRAINTRSFGAHNVIKVCGFTEEAHGLRLGDALGNHFRIALRLYRTAESSPSSRMKEILPLVEELVRTTGVINYFGPQRFGTTTVLTSDVGTQFLQGHLREGLRLILLSKSTMVPEMQNALHCFDEEDYAGALQATPYYCYLERDILKHLSLNRNDYLGSLKTVARTMAMMYFHAVQSLVWNRMASSRLSTAERMHAEVGDLVLQSTYEASSREDTNHELEKVDDVIPVAEEAKLPPVHRLTKEDNCSRFTLADVLLPVPGPDQDLVYPTATGCTRDDYDAVLRELQIDFTSKEALSLMKVFHFHGTYRALGVLPKGFQLTLETVPSWRSPVLKSDWAIHCEAESKTVEVPGSGDVSATAPEPVGPIEVVVASFSLPPGSYATSVLREFCIPCTENYNEGGAVAEAAE